MMKKAKILTIVLVAVLLAGIGAGAFFLGRGSRYIGRDRALEIALADRGLTRSEVTDVDVDLERDGSGRYYEVDFELPGGGQDVKYRIDATTGVILSGSNIQEVTPNKPGQFTQTTPVEKPEFSPPSEEIPIPVVTPELATASVTAPASAGGAPVSDGTPANNGAYISREEALAAALTDAGLTEDQAYDIDVDLELRRGANAYYEVDFDTATTDYKYDVDAVTGEILRSRAEAEDLDRHGSSAQSGEYIGKEAALAAALADAGLTEDQVYDIDVELDSDGGIVRYEVDFETRDTEYEYDIDAVTGEILLRWSEPNL